MPDYKLNRLSSLLYESYYPRARIRFNLSQTATELEEKGRQIAPHFRSLEPFHARSPRWKKMSATAAASFSISPLQQRGPARRSLPYSNWKLECVLPPHRTC